MVDEYQDTNELQLEMLKLITDETHNNICVVGDDFQSIYRFRGANFKNILNFRNLYKDTKIIILNQNYRSNQEILDTANAVILSGKEKFEKNLTAQLNNIDIQNEDGTIENLGEKYGNKPKKLS